jgi:sRNA-binding carbon storage regulator CsrA
MHTLNHSNYQSINISNDFSVGVLDCHGDRIRIRIPAPKETVHREGSFYRARQKYLDSAIWNHILNKVLPISRPETGCLIK